MQPDTKLSAICSKSDYKTIFRSHLSIEITTWDKDGSRRRERTKAENIKSVDMRMNNIIRWLDVMKRNGNIAEFGVELYQE